MACDDWLAVFLLLVATTTSQVRLVHGELHVNPEDISKTITVYNRNGTGSIGHGSSVEQEWHTSGSCPAGIIPIRRLPKNAIEPNITMMQLFLEPVTPLLRITQTLPKMRLKLVI
ncbi:hypothetical protein EJB05_45067 [Eragrostis curvula]|uniref:Neprosin activation peptide domain-containing protein n=1 Tax=Eragrostis curvula TaxID=38414 RepID=A0A5J9TJB3_9POAL|nr:hypothetical protein EJB05_45067 [Eragrostis curvula]